MGITNGHHQNDPGRRSPVCGAARVTKRAVVAAAGEALDGTHLSATNLFGSSITDIEAG